MTKGSQPAPALSRERERRHSVALGIAGMIEQLSRSVASQGFVAGLNPAQWAALRHVASANESARTVGAFARLHRTTPSSASQTISALTAKGLLTKTVGADGRLRVLTLTAAGLCLLDRDPLLRLAGTIASFPDDRMLALAEALQSLAQAAMGGGESAPPAVSKGRPAPRP